MPLNGTPEWRAQQEMVGLAGDPGDHCTDAQDALRIARQVEARRVCVCGHLAVEHHGNEFVRLGLRRVPELCVRFDHADLTAALAAELVEQALLRGVLL